MSARLKVLWGVMAVAVVLLAAAWNTLSPARAGAQAAQATAQPTPGHSGGGMSPTERLHEPPVSDPPTQIELGRHEYWMSCMVCHGDRGQGLTEEWRSVLDPEDQNCWQAKCHGAAHPPYGFQIPRTSPLIMGTGALTGYKTAEELFAYLRVKMPWSYPGLFEDKDYWQLTAYLADVNKVDLGDGPLGPENGDEVLLLPHLVQSHHEGTGVERIVAGAIAGLLLGAAALYWLVRAR
jgi:mono/diheme cytochrome c family protein